MRGKQMKTKNKILLFTGVVPFIIVIMMIFSVKHTLNKETDPSLSDSERINSEKRSYDFKNFENISAEGVWDINLMYDDQFKVELVAPVNMMSEITVNKTDRTLILASKKDSYSLFSNYKKPRINITLPLISRLDIDGVANIKISEFKNTEISIFMNGVMNITGESCSIDQFSLNGTGVVNVAMNDVPVTNAHFKYSGIYNINILMNGGELTGKLDGIGKMIASGEIAENSIKVNGPGSLKIIQ